MIELEEEELQPEELPPEPRPGFPEKAAALISSAKIQELIKRCAERRARVIRHHIQFRRKQCVVCIHENIDDINFMLIDQVDHKYLIKKYDFTAIELQRHSLRHVEPVIRSVVPRSDLRHIGERLAELVRRRSRLSFPLDGLEKQLKFIANDLLLIRKISYGEITESNIVMQAPNVGRLMECSRLLRMVVLEMDRAKKERLRLIPPRNVSDEIDKDVLDPVVQMKIEQGRMKSEEHYEEAINAITGGNFTKPASPNGRRPAAQKDNADEPGERTLSALTRTR